MTLHGTTKRTTAVGPDLHRARADGVRIAEAAGRLLAKRYAATWTIRGKGTNGDVVTDLDLAAEQLIIDGLRSCYPDHAIVAEESGLGGGDDDRWTWLIDPLDGTNNVVVGLPVFAVGLALCHDRVPVVGVVHDPVSRATWSAVRCHGAQGPGVGSRPHLRRAPSLGWTQGYAVGSRDPLARSLRLVLEDSAHRVLQLWAPLLCWVMLARGDIDGIVGFRPEAIDLPAGVLIAQEAGIDVRALDGRRFDDTIDVPGHHRDRSFVAGPADVVEWLVTLAKEARRVEPAFTRLWQHEHLTRPPAPRLHDDRPLGGDPG